VTILGITGGSGSGKTTLLSELAKRGALVIDCDEVYHDLLNKSAELLKELNSAFPGVVTPPQPPLNEGGDAKAALREGGDTNTTLTEGNDANAPLFEGGGGELDRKALGAIVFADAEKLNTLTAITNKYVDVEVTRLLNDYPRNPTLRGGQGGVAAIDAIALVESGLAKRCDAVITVIAPVEVRVERLMKREGISRDYALSRIAAQKPDEWFATNSDYVLDNNGSEYEFTLKCRALLDELLN
jgi:dephospho-CoA kinase